MAKIKVYRKDTGEVVRVPEHFLENPILARAFRKTPSQKSRDLAREAAVQAGIEQAALETLHQTSTPRAGGVAEPINDNESANAGDDKKE